MDPILVGKAVTTPESLPASQGKVFLQPKFGNRTDWSPAPPAPARRSP